MENPFTDEYFMKKALQEAEMAFEKDEIPVGALIVIDNKVIARGHNLTEMLNDVTAHAEMQAITAAANFLGGKYLTGCTLYVTLEPCTMCSGAIVNSRLARVVYGASEPRTGAAGSVLDVFANRTLNHHTQITRGVLEDECKLLMQFFVTLFYRLSDDDLSEMLGCLQ